MEHSNEIHAIASAVAGVLRQERLGLQKALEMIRRAEQMSLEIQVPMAISVVDEGGNLIAFHRMDDSLLASIAVSQSKAYTAAALRCSKMILPGEALYGLQNTHPGRFCLFGGGVPVMVNGRCIGGLGISGGTAEQDTAVAEYAIKQET